MKVRVWLTLVPLGMGLLLSLFTSGLVWLAVGAMLAYVGFQKGDEIASGVTRVFTFAKPERAPTILPPIQTRMILPPVREAEPWVETHTKEEVDKERVVFQPGMDFAIGVTDSGVEITMPKLTSVWVAGVGGMGKSVDMVSLAMQSIIKYDGEVRFVVIDPHMGAGPDALSSRLAPMSAFFLHETNFPNPVSGGAPVRVWIDWLRDLAKKRKSGLDAHMKIVVLVDEFTELLDDEEIGGALNKLLIEINEQSRKVNIFAIVASQQLKSTRIKGTDLRNTVSTFLLHNMPPALARQVVPEEFANRSNRLKVGQAIFSSAGEQAIVRITDRTPDEISSRIMRYLPMEDLAPKTVITQELRESVVATHEMLVTLGYEPELAAKVIAIDAFGLENIAQGKRHVTQILAEGLTDE